ncbi:uncharacterized protein KY384_006469 [Bacidia gigantensis]|uniref:uncharacterized protein n=1 Tax=Bacidia gigantensis TaxID=2732470 RepID=UPI001D0378A0|nr:uncharacterized protein KY384_006469 [Bacidia gigantensis]KAG8528781.1 hypothetical protein KY384_006469 [Bacidia gigantensis]
MRTSFLHSSLWLLSLTPVRAQWPVDAQAATVRELEHLFLDAATYNLKRMITPCSQYIDSSTGLANPNLGRQTAAEWIRTAFHDFVTGNIYTLQGGLDASIGFETTRAENVGTAFNDALTNFGYYFNAAVSMADLISLGTVLAAGHCGGVHVPMRGGRKDAAAAGPTGVPQPQQDLNTQLGVFGNAGFNRDDTIALTACGHTLGGVHKKDFPDVVNNAPGTQTGTDGRIAFDETDSGFDNGLVNDYLGSKNAKGGPLVTTTNVTVQSDLRLYVSDQNATMQRLGQSNDYFLSQCSSTFQRMIETVPSGVRLSTPIDPTTTTNLKPYNVDLNVDWSGNMVCTGNLRYVQVPGSAAGPGSYTVTLIGRDGKTTTTTATATKSAADSGTGIYGATNSYKFQLSFPASTGLSGISVGGQTFKFQDSMFPVPGKSSVSPTPPPFTSTPALNAQQSYTANLTVAYLTTAPPATLTATFSIPVPQTGTVSPKTDASTQTQLKLIGKTGPFAIYSGLTTKTLSGKQVYSLSVDVAASGQAGGLGFYKIFNKDS